MSRQELNLKEMIEHSMGRVTLVSIFAKGQFFIVNYVNFRFNGITSYIY